MKCLFYILSCCVWHLKYEEWSKIPQNPYSRKCPKTILVSICSSVSKSARSTKAFAAPAAWQEAFSTTWNNILVLRPGYHISSTKNCGKNQLSSCPPVDDVSSYRLSVSSLLSWLKIESCSFKKKLKRQQYTIRPVYQETNEKHKGWCFWFTSKGLQVGMSAPEKL